MYRRNMFGVFTTFCLNFVLMWMFAIPAQAQSATDTFYVADSTQAALPDQTGAGQDDIIVQRAAPILQVENILIYLPYVTTFMSTPSTPDPVTDSNNVADAITIFSGQAIQGAVDSEDDRFDVYKIDSSPFQLFDIRLRGTEGDADLHLHAPDTQVIPSEPSGSATSHPSSNEDLDGRLLIGGYWYIVVHAYSGSTDYELTATLITPEKVKVADSNNVADAITIFSGQIIQGAVASGPDRSDVYKIDTIAAHILDIRLRGTDGDGNADLYVHWPETQDIVQEAPADSSTSPSSNEDFVRKVPRDGYWYIEVRAFTGSTDYELFVRLREP